MSKGTVAWLLMAVACGATACTLLFPDTFTMLVAGGAASLLAFVAAIVRPRQAALAALAALLTLGHAVLWAWMALIHFNGL